MKTRLRINIWKPMFRSKCRKPKKKGDTNMESFHVINPFLFYPFPKGMINNFKPFAKKSISLRIVIIFKGRPIYGEVAIC